jgi:pimeloyl-ACP methyl ester carboxylesterase
MSPNELYAETIEKMGFQEQTMQRTSSTIQTSDSQLAYEIIGDGPALVLLHADVADRRMWDAHLAVLAQHFRVIRYDRPGFGDSAPVDSIRSHHDDLAALLDGLDVAQAHVLGCSRGGEIALSFALTYPQRTLSVVAVSATPSGFEMQGALPPGLMEMMTAYQQGDIEKTADWMNRIYLAGEGRDLDAMDVTLAQRVYDMNVIALRNHAWEIAEREPLTPPAAGRLDELQIPVLAVVGMLDNAELVRAARLIEQEAPRGESWLVDGVAHLLPLEVPELFVAHVLRFLGV